MLRPTRDGGIIREPTEPLNGSQLRVRETRSAFIIRAQRNAFRRRDARQQSKVVRPCVSIAETQPQLQPALLRLREFPSTTFDRPAYNDSHDYKTALRCIHRSVHFRFPI